MNTLLWFFLLLSSIVQVISRDSLEPNRSHAISLSRIRIWGLVDLRLLSGVQQYYLIWSEICAEKCHFGFFFLCFHLGRHPFRFQRYTEPLHWLVNSLLFMSLTIIRWGRLGNAMVNKQRAELTMTNSICIFVQLYSALNFIAILTFWVSGN